MTKTSLVLRVGSIITIFLVGAAVGVWLDRTNSFTSHADHEEHGDHTADQHLDDRQHPDHEEHHGDHVALSEQSFANLRMRVEPVSLTDHFLTRTVPGEVVEVPGRGNRALSVPVGGVITDIHVRPGQALRAGDALFELQIVDEELSKAQLALLDVMTKLAVIRDEIARLAPLSERGAIAGRQRIELEYERRTLEAQWDTRLQELAIRGLTKEQIATIVSDRELVTKLTIRMPDSLSENAFDTLASQVSWQPDKAEALRGKFDNERNYTVESLAVYRGAMVRRGGVLCQLANHTEFYIRGQAFESDIDAISRLDEHGWNVAVDFTHNHMHDHKPRLTRDDLKILYIDNHVDPKTQTFLFYIPLANEIEKDSTDAAGRVYRHWRFKPGQRVHIRVPVERWEQQIRLPASAVVDEGIDVFAFREHIDEPYDDETSAVADLPEDEHHEEDVFIEFEPVAVRVLYRDETYVVIANDGQLKIGENVALNNAYQLHLAMKAASGGGHHHHHH